MSSDIVWTPVQCKQGEQHFLTETAGYTIQIHGGPHPYKQGELVWSFNVKSKDGNCSTSGQSKGQSRQAAENYAFAWMGVRSVGKFIGLKMVLSHDGWGYSVGSRC